MYNQNNTQESSHKENESQPNKVPGIEPAELQNKTGRQMDLEELIKMMEEEKEKENKQNT
jgi:hypothetical protein